MKILSLAIVSFLLLPLCGSSQIYVSVTGSDTAAGTKEKPLASVSMAMRKARELRRLSDASIANGIRIVIEDGIYPLSEPLFIRPEDAGSETSPTILEAAPGARPVISGGLRVWGWKKLNETIPNLPKKAAGKVWVTEAPTAGGDLLDFRQLWVNDRKATRARDKNGDSLHRISSWDKKKEECWIPKTSVSPAAFEGVEMVILQWWAIANLRIRSAEVRGDQVRLRFHQPESRIQSEHPWPAPWISSETGNSPFYLTNSIQFLDSPGEWFLDKKRHKLYYWPLDEENLQKATVVVPQLEKLVQASGTAEQPVRHVHFKGITFQHTTWMRPSRQGHVPLQTGMYLLDAYKLKIPGTPDKAGLENQAWVGRPPGAIEVNYADNIRFEGCRFSQLASTGLDFHKGVQNSTVIGGVFNDIGGSAILAGVFSDEATEAHLPYLPGHTQDQTSRITISNNIIHNAASEDWGCVGIGTGFISQSTIERNELSELPYTGISLGWGWTKTKNSMQANRVTANRITRYGKHLYDVAAIYTLSAQPGTEISGNYIDSAYKASYAHLPSHWFYLYTDEGTSGVTVRNNWTPSPKYLQNANGPGNIWENNGPQVDPAIRNAAGLQPAWQPLRNSIALSKPTRPINHELPVIVEVIAGKGQVVDAVKLQAVLKENGLESNSLYQWQNHLVVFDKVQDASVLKGKIQKAFPQQTVKVYYDAFYEFNRSQCIDTSTAGSWEHYLFTANLVEDPKLQQEYLHYHNTQSEKWPEISQGFCNASFQQLLLYRNGRQLMLVISVPKGESLDKLNPKTAENNPRVHQWNQLMKKYQEGIPDAGKGTVWIGLTRWEQ